MRATQWSKRIVAWRTFRCLTQEQVAERAGLSRITVVRIEGAHQVPHATTLHKLARAFRIRVEQLSGEPHT